MPVERAALADAMQREVVTAALTDAFDPEGYFKRVTGAACRAALKEMGDGMKAGSKKADLAALAVAKAKVLGWLPPEWRTAHYAGPGAVTIQAEAAQ